MTLQSSSSHPIALHDMDAATDAATSDATYTRCMLRAVLEIKHWPGRNPRRDRLVTLCVTVCCSQQLNCLSLLL
jgi:hypothetical protein